MIRNGEGARNNILERSFLALGLAAGAAALVGCTAGGPSTDIHVPATKTTTNREVKGLPAGTKIYEDYRNGKLLGYCATLPRDVPLGDLNGPDQNGVDSFLHHQPGLDDALGQHACEDGGKTLYAEPRASTIGAPQV